MRVLQVFGLTCGPTHVLQVFGLTCGSTRVLQVFGLTCGLTHALQLFGLTCGPTRVLQVFGLTCGPTRVLQVYVLNTRKGWGVGTLPQGKEFYQACLKWYLSLNMTPDEVHQLGLREVARTEALMQRVTHCHCNVM